MAFERSIRSVQQPMLQPALLDYGGGPSPGILRSEATAQKFLLLKELLDSEAEYVALLKLAWTVFQKPLGELAGTGGEVLSASQIRKTFGPLDRFIPLHEKGIFYPLKERLLPLTETKAESLSVGDLFTRNRAELLKVYSEYSAEADGMHTALVVLRRNNPAFRRFLTQRCRDGASEDHYLEDLLILPLRRVETYRTLLDGLLASAVGPEAAAGGSLVEARDFMMELSRRLHVARASAEEAYFTDVLYRRLVRSPAQPFPQEVYGKLIKEGPMLLEARPGLQLREVHVHLFNHALLVSVPLRQKFLNKFVLPHSATEYRAGSHLYTATARGVLQGFNFDRQILVTGVDGLEFSLVAKDTSDRDRWYETIRNQVNDWRHLERDVVSQWAQFSNSFCPEIPEVAPLNPIENPFFPQKEGVVQVVVRGVTEPVNATPQGEKRFVRVQDGVISVSAGAQDTGNVVVRAPLEGAVLSLPTEGREGSPSYCLQLAYPDQVLQFSCASGADMDAWVEALRPVSSIRKLDVQVQDASVIMDRLAGDLNGAVRAQPHLQPILQPLADRVSVEGKQQVAWMWESAARVREELQAKDRLINILLQDNYDLKTMIFENVRVYDVASRERRLVRAQYEHVFARQATPELHLTRCLEAAMEGFFDIEDDFVKEEKIQVETLTPVNITVPETTALVEYAPQRVAQVSQGTTISPSLSRIQASLARTAPGAASVSNAVMELPMQEEETPMGPLTSRFLTSEVERLTSDNIRLREKLKQFTERAVLTTPTAAPMTAAQEADYVRFVYQRAELVCWLREMKAVYTAALATDMKAADLTRLKREFDEYEKVIRVRRVAEYQELGKRAAELRARRGSEPCDMVEVDRLWSDLGLAEHAFADLVNEEEQRRALMAQRKAEFQQEATRLLLWSRQQKSNVEVLEEPDHVQEFCASLQNSVSQMGGKMRAFAEMAEILLPDKEVEAQLLEVCEVWLHMQLFAYEKMRHVLLEVHQQSHLEDEVRAFSGYSRQLRSFLDQVEKLLQLPTDEESMAVVRPVLEQCQQLQQDFGPFRLLTDHMADFALRMECLRDNYSVLKESVLSKLTYLGCHVSTLDRSFPRQKEFDSHVAAVGNWVGCAARTPGVPSMTFGGWGALLRQVRALKDTVNRELGVTQEDPSVEDELWQNRPFALEKLTPVIRPLVLDFGATRPAMPLPKTRTVPALVAPPQPPQPPRPVNVPLVWAPAPPPVQCSPAPRPVMAEPVGIPYDRSVEASEQSFDSEY